MKETTIFLLFLAVLLLFHLLFFLAIKIRLNAAKAQGKLLMEKWRLAREKRKLWEEEHPFSLDFRNPEYQELWELEIGAEALYLLQAADVYAHEISWHEYRLLSDRAKEEE